jgi:hypothetical protein
VFLLFYVIDTGSTGSRDRDGLGIACLPFALMMTLAMLPLPLFCVPQSASGLTRVTVSRLARTETSAVSLPGQDHICQFDIIRVATRFILAGARGELA